MPRGDSREESDAGPPRPARDRDARTGRSAAAQRSGDQQSWVDQQIRVAMAKGEFDDLPGKGKPIEGLGGHHDPDWWLKKLVEREQITGVLPPSLQLRKEDAELDARIDRLPESEARREIEDFNERVIRARYSPAEGPPLITMPRDVDETVAAWRERRDARRRARKPMVEREAPPAPTSKWWRRSRR